MIIHNGQFAECEVLENFKDFVVQGQGQRLVNCPRGSSEDNDFPRAKKKLKAKKLKPRYLV